MRRVESQLLESSQLLKNQGISAVLLFFVHPFELRHEQAERVPLWRIFSNFISSFSFVANDLREEEARQREVSEQKRHQKLEEERRKRQVAEAEQTARSKLFQYALASKVNLVKQMVEAPESNTGEPVSYSSKAVNLEGWEYLDFSDDSEDPDITQGACETLLHIACRVKSIHLVTYLIDRGMYYCVTVLHHIPIYFQLLDASSHDITLFMKLILFYHFFHRCATGRSRCRWSYTPSRCGGANGVTGYM